MGWSYLYYAQTKAKGSGVFDRGDINRWKYHMSGVPFLGDFIRAGDQTRYFQDYLSNRGIDWSRVEYPSMNIGAGSYARASTNLALGSFYVSKNIDRFYNGGYVRDRGYSGYEYL